MVAGIALAVVVQAGCLGGSIVASSRGVTRVDSIPQGAQVFVMGERVGVTPVEIEDRLIFPVTYPAERAALYGRVVLEHEGCEPTSRAIDLTATNEGTTIELSCDASAATSSDPPAMPRD